jgi:hypothetical protein
MSAPTIDHTLDEILNLAATHFKVPREKLSPDDDFFKTLGIDSLQALDASGASLPHRVAGLRTAGRVRFSDAGESNPGAAIELPFVTFLVNSCFCSRLRSEITHLNA